MAPLPQTFPLQLCQWKMECVTSSPWTPHLYTHGVIKLLACWPQVSWTVTVCVCVCVSSYSMPTRNKKKERQREVINLKGPQHLIRSQWTELKRTHAHTHTYYSRVTQRGDWCLYRSVSPSLSAAMETMASWITIISLMCPLPLLPCYFNLIVCVCVSEVRVGILCATVILSGVRVCIVTSDGILCVLSKCWSRCEFEINYVCVILGAETMHGED